MTRQISTPTTLFRTTVFAGLIGLLFLIIYILTQFHFQYTDMDQVLMWFGANEFKSFQIHSLRFYGQDYGSMLEALIASIIPTRAYALSLPIVSALLLFTPYALMFNVTRSYSSLGLIVGSLLLLPIEYFLIGFMPRDFVTGIAVSSFALLFLKKRVKWSYVMIGVLCVTGWSIQQNAALFGAVISVFASFKKGQFSPKAFLWLSVGYGFGFTFHLLGQQYFNSHPELIVHRAWEFHYAWKQLWDGWSNLDRHFAWIVPVFKGQGWIMLLLFVIVLTWAWVKRKWEVFWSALALFFLTFLSFGVLKIHDGRDNVFFSHERMFLALPIALLFLVHQLIDPLKKGNTLNQYWTFILLPIVCISIFRLSGFEEIKAYQLDDKRDHVARVMAVSEFKELAQNLKNISDEHEVDWVIASPIADQSGLMLACGFNALYHSPIVLDPSYERRTWEMRRLSKDKVRRFLWISDIDIEVFALEYRCTKLKLLNGKNVWLVEGEGLQPLDLFGKTGYQISNH